MPSFIKKFFASVAVSLILFLSVAPYFTVNAVGTDPGGTGSSNINSTSGTPSAGTSGQSGAPAEWYNQSFPEWFGKVYDPSNPGEIFGERYTAAQVQWVFYSVFSMVISTVIGNKNMTVVQCFLNNVTDVGQCSKELSGLAQRTESAALAAKQPEKQSLWQMVFASDRPLSGIAYVKDRVQNFSLTPTVHAAGPGFGFNALEPVRAMWTGVRDMAFGLFVIAAVVLAFMIMFRVKISPQVVISVQSAIPKIIIALVLVTFSYAIAGFLVDLMYVVIGLVSLIGPNISVITLKSSDVFALMTTYNIFLVLIGYLLALVFGFLLLFIAFTGPLLSGVLGAALVAAIGATGGILGILLVVLVVILAIVALWNVIKVLWSLLKAFANVLLLTIFAPLEIVAGVVIPSLGFGAWVKSFVSALSVFVVTGTLMFLAIVFLVNGASLGWQGFADAGSGFDLGKFTLSIVIGSGFSNQATGQAISGWPPMLGGGSSSALVGLLFLGVSFVLFTMIPKANELIQSILSGKPFSYGTSLGELTGPAGKLYTGYAGAQLAGGSVPAPFDRIPGLEQWYRKTFSTDESRQSLGRQVADSTRTR